MFMFFNNFKFLFVLAIAFVLFASPVFAISVEDTGLSTTAETAKLTTQNTDIPIIVGLIIKTFLGLLGLILLCIIVYGAFLWMTAGGNETQVKKAQAFFVNGIIGLAIALLAYLITSFVVDKIVGEWNL